MATIRKRRGKWQAIVRRAGHPSTTRTFTNKKDAELWAKSKEVQLEQSILPNSNKSVLKSTTLRDLVIRYRDTVTVYKKAGDTEALILNAFLRDPICKKTLAQLTTADFARYRDKRLREIKPETVKRQLTPIRNMFNIARKEWGVPVQNPLEDLTLKVNEQKRDRRLQDGELDVIIRVATDHARNSYIIPIIIFALETGMRRGEILSIKWQHIGFDSRSLLIPDTKNGQSRIIPLTPKAIQILQTLRDNKDGKGSDVFPLTANAFRLAWTRVIKKTGIQNLRFHDLRHEAISRFFEMGLNIAEVSSISGHLDVKMLFRYTHPKVGDILQKLNKHEADQGGIRL